MRRISFAALALLLSGPAASRADIIYQYVTDQTAYSGSGSVSVNVFLQETVTGASTSLLNQTQGLLGYGFYIKQTGGPSSGQSLLGSVTSQAPWTAFPTQSSPIDLPPNSIDYFNAQTLPTTPTTTGTIVAPGVRRILLGSVSVSAGALTTFTLQSLTHSPGLSANAGADGNTLTLPTSGSYDLDLGGTQSGSAGSQTFIGADAASSTFTVAAVPEPASVVLTGITLAIFAICLYRRRAARLATH